MALESANYQGGEKLPAVRGKTGSTTLEQVGSRCCLGTAVLTCPVLLRGFRQQGRSAELLPVQTRRRRQMPIPLWEQAALPPAITAQGSDL